MHQLNATSKGGTTTCRNDAWIWLDMGLSENVGYIPNEIAI